MHQSCLILSQNPRRIGSPDFLPFLMLFVRLAAVVEFLGAQLQQPFMKLAGGPVEPGMCKKMHLSGSISKTY